MKRRNFLKITAPAAAAPFVLGNMSLSALANTDLSLDPCDLATDRAIVIIKLGGGTDGINLVVPIEQYDTYATLRPTIKHTLNEVITLDSTLDANDQVGLHPGMQKFKDLYDNGKFHIVQGVSYPHANRSHFRSSKVMNAGLQGNSSLANPIGWASRYLKYSFDPNLSLDPLGIAIGSEGIFTNNYPERYHVSLKTGGIDAMYNFANTLPENFEDTSSLSDYNKSLEHIINTNDGIEQFSSRIYNVYNSGSNHITANYPNNSLAEGLRLVAKLISGGSTTKVFSLNMGGWDTHNQEKNRQNSLVNKLTDSIDTFMTDLSAQNLDHRVIGATYSEMGRGVAQNANGGTDHGLIFPMFLFGSGVKPGISGTNVDLSNISGNVLHNPQHDYRDILTSMMQDWLGSDTSCITDAGFGSFLNTEINMVDADKIVDSECYSTLDPGVQARLSQDSVFTQEQQDHINIFPNPSFGKFQIEFYSSIDEEGYMKIIDIQGKEVYNKNVTLFEEDNTFSIQLDVPSGIYAVMLISNENGVKAGDYVIIK